MAKETLAEMLARKKAEAGKTMAIENGMPATIEKPSEGIATDTLAEQIKSMLEAEKVEKSLEAEAIAEKSKEVILARVQKPLVSTEASIDDLLDAPMMSTEQRILQEAQIVTADIIPRIRQLNSLSDMEAENEMKLLKAALMANPEAVALMLPTDVGLLVQSLRRITKEAVIEAASKVKKPKEKKIDAQSMQQMLADVDDF